MHANVVRTSRVRRPSHIHAAKIHCYFDLLSLFHSLSLNFHVHRTPPRLWRGWAGIDKKRRKLAWGIEGGGKKNGAIITGLKKKGSIYLFLARVVSHGLGVVFCAARNHPHERT